MEPLAGLVGLAIREDVADRLRAAPLAVVAPTGPVAPTPPPSVPAPSRPPGHVYQVSGEWYADTAFMGALGLPLDHVGYGDFRAKAPGGNLLISRHAPDVLVPQQSGRLHRLSHSAGEAALSALIRELVDAGRAELVGTWATWPTPETTPAPALAPAAESTVAHLYQIEGKTYADEPILKLLAVRPVNKVDYAVDDMNLAWIRRDDPLPEQVGRLFQLDHDGGARAISRILDPLLKTGALRFVGGWASWDGLGDEPSHVQYRAFGKGPGALLPPGLEAML